MNKQNLNPKELEITNEIALFFAREEINNIDIYVDHSSPPIIEFKNDLVRLVYRIEPEDPDCEEQLQIPTIILDRSLRNRGIFKRLMAVLVAFCKKYNNTPIVFTEVVSEHFADKLIRYGGRVLHDDQVSGKYIAVLPEKWN